MSLYGDSVYREFRRKSIEGAGKGLDEAHHRRKKRFMYPAEGRGGSAASQSYRGLTAAVIVGVDVVGDQADPEIPPVAHGPA